MPGGLGEGCPRAPRDTSKHGLEGGVLVCRAGIPGIQYGQGGAHHDGSWVVKSQLLGTDLGERPSGTRPRRRWGRGRRNRRLSPHGRLRQKDPGPSGRRPDSRDCASEEPLTAFPLSSTALYRKRGIRPPIALASSKTSSRRCPRPDQSRRTGADSSSPPTRTRLGLVDRRFHDQVADEPARGSHS